MEHSTQRLTSTITVNIRIIMKKCEMSIAKDAWPDHVTQRGRQLIGQSKSAYR